MSSCNTTHVRHEMALSEILEGLHEYQTFLVDSAGKVASNQLAMKLYDLAEQHADLERQLRELSPEVADGNPPVASPFLNQIRTLRERLRKFDDLSSSRYVLCEIIQTEERMIRRFQILIDQITDTQWKRRLTIQLHRLLDMRNSLGQLRDDRSSRRSTDPGQPGVKPPHINRLN